MDILKYRNNEDTFYNQGIIKGTITYIRQINKYLVIHVRTKIGTYYNYPTVYIPKEILNAELKKGDYVVVKGRIDSRKKTTKSNDAKYEQLFIADEINITNKNSTDITFHMYENQIKLKGIVNKVSDNNSSVVLLSLKMYDCKKNKWAKIFVAAYGDKKEMVKNIKPGDVVDLLGNIQTVLVTKQDKTKRKEPIVLQNLIVN
jgi:hypothetical protein